MPTLTDLCINVRNYLLQNGVDLDEEDFEEIFFEIQKRENYLFENANSFHALNNTNPYKVIQTKKHKRKEHKNGEIKVKSKTTFGLLKCIAGGLICIIPIPAVQAVGAGLILNGINDCIDSAREQGDENEQIQKMEEQRRREAETGLSS